jgi:hypothetical protein
MELFKMLKKIIKIPFWLIFFILPTILFSFATSSIAAYQIILAWDANTEPDIEGYVVYSKQGSQYPPYDYVDTYPEVDLADPSNPRAVITDLESDVTYSFVVTAYDTEGNESDFSNAVSVLNGKIIDGGVNSNGDSGDSGGCFINTAAYWFRTSETILDLPFSDPK